MELKYQIITALMQGNNGCNRTFMELKSKLDSDRLIKDCCNRTFMELKYYRGTVFVNLMQL